MIKQFINYYDVLGVDEKADKDVIRKAYKRLAIKWHPDKNPDNREEADAKFKLIGEAYTVLSDENKRKEYELFRSGKGKFKLDPMDPYVMFQKMCKKKKTTFEAGGIMDMDFDIDSDDDDKFKEEPKKENKEPEKKVEKPPEEEDDDEDFGFGGDVKDLKNFKIK